MQYGGALRTFQFGVFLPMFPLSTPVSCHSQRHVAKCIAPDILQTVNTSLRDRLVDLDSLHCRFPKKTLDSLAEVAPQLFVGCSWFN